MLHVQVWGGGDGGASKTGGQVHGQWGCFCGVRSPGDGTDGDGDVVGLGGQLLPQRRMQHFLIVDKDGKPANADEGHMLVGTLQVCERGEEWHMGGWAG